MKRILMLMAMTLGLALISGCEKPAPSPTPDPKPEPPQPALQSFEVAVNAVTETSMTYTVTPSVLDQEYIAVVKTKESLAALQDEQIVETVFEDIKAAAASAGITFNEKMTAIAVKGVSENIEITGLAVDTEYSLVVFGVDPAKDWEYTTFPVVKDFKTNAVEVIEYTFDVTTTVENNTVTFQVVPSDNTVAWHLMTVTKDMYDYYTDPAGENAWTKDVFYQAYVESEIQSYAEAGYTEDQILAAMFLTGEQSLYAEGLNANTEYVYFVAAFKIEGTQLYIASEIAEGAYTTGEAPKTELTFDISVTDVDQMRAAIKITPSDLEAPFTWIVQQYDGVSTPEEVMNAVIDANKMFLDMGFMSSYGVQDYTGGPGSPYKYKVGSPDTDFCVIAFGYAGGVTSDPEMVTFRTLPGGNPADCTFEAQVQDVTTYGFSFKVTPSDPTTYFTGDVCLASEYDEARIAEEIEAGIQELYDMQAMFGSPMEMSDLIANYFWNGESVMDAQNLTPDTEYTMYLVALDQKTGKVAKIHVFPAFAKTKPVGTVVPELELIGYFSGDDENGAVFGQPAATAGMCIAVVKYNADPTATVYSSILEGNGMDTEQYPDATIMDNAYWQEVNMNEPYSFFLINWDADNTAFAYAVDANGGQGGVSRLLLNCSEANKNNIDELFALIDQVYGQTSTTTSVAPFNISEVKGEPVVTVREKAKTVSVEPSPMVARPVEQMALRAGNLMQLNYVPSFWVK
ncbi:MAG: hypothetical protein J6R30_08095 [Bacteroidales bacterium]|nr:hypothetical protein [Bacteroidales bacterium]